MNTELPDYDVVADVLKSAGLESDAAECHGALCALLCTIDRLIAAHWLTLYLTAEKAALLPENALAVLGTIFEATESQIDNPEFSFHLLLPDDDSGLDVKVEAISSWCQGFLMGLGLGGVTDIDNLPADLPELVQDFIKISRADALSLDDADASENAFEEIMEYVRVGTLMFREEMKALNAPSRDENQPLH